MPHGLPGHDASWIPGCHAERARPGDIGTGVRRNVRGVNRRRAGPSAVGGGIDADDGTSIEVGAPRTPTVSTSTSMTGVDAAIAAEGEPLHPLERVAVVGGHRPGHLVGQRGERTDQLLLVALVELQGAVGGRAVQRGGAQAVGLQFLGHARPGWRPAGPGWRGPTRARSPGRPRSRRSGRPRRPAGPRPRRRNRRPDSRRRCTPPAVRRRRSARCPSRSRRTGRRRSAVCRCRCRSRTSALPSSRRPPPARRRCRR